MKPNKWQTDASQFIYERDNSMLLAKTGTGKTLCYLLALQDWLEAKEIKRAIVTAPLRVCNTVWRQEAEKWGIPINFTLCTGEMSKADQTEAVVCSPYSQLLVNHSMLPKVLDADHGADALIIDELSLFRRPSGTWQKKARFSNIRIRTGGTGTPAPNGLMSLYGMTHAVGIPTFGRNVDKWKRRYFYPTDYQQYNWAPFKETPDELARAIKPWTYTLEEGAVELPPVVRPPIVLDLPVKIRRKYEEMRATSQLSDEEIVAGGAGIVRLKLRQILSGFAYDKDGEAVSLEDDYRLDALKEIVAEQNGQPIIIVYEFREQLRLMRNSWPNFRWIGGNSNDEKTIADWNAGRIDVLGLHPYAAGHGLNVQYGGCALAWWQMPDDAEAYEQTLARLARRGQPSPHVYSYEPCVPGTIDSAVVERYHVKAGVQNTLWDALRHADGRKTS